MNTRHATGNVSSPRHRTMLNRMKVLQKHLNPIQESQKSKKLQQVELNSSQGFSVLKSRSKVLSQETHLMDYHAPIPTHHITSQVSITPPPSPRLSQTETPTQSSTKSTTPTTPTTPRLARISLTSLTSLTPLSQNPTPKSTMETNLQVSNRDILKLQQIENIPLRDALQKLHENKTFESHSSSKDAPPTLETSQADIFPSQEELKTLSDMALEPEMVHFDDGIECKEIDVLENLPETMQAEIQAILKEQGIVISQ